MTMGDFAAAWLDLREPFDMKARDKWLTEQLVDWRSGYKNLRVMDLGTGTGANGRYLIPKLKGRQQWTLIDNDPDLLRQLQPRLTRWGREAGLQVASFDSGLEIEGADVHCHLVQRSLDLSSGFSGCPRDIHLVTASAFLDLVSSAWLDGALQYCRAVGAAFFVSLSYDGRIQWQPVDADDELVREAVNRHQRSDKGFGPALGPDAPAYAVTCFRQGGFQVLTRSSDWQLGPADQGLQLALAKGYRDVALQQQPVLADRVDAWFARRQAHIAAADSRLIVGHGDMFARPQVEVKTF